MLAIEQRLYGIAPRALHRDRIRKSLAGIRREAPAQPVGDLGWIAVEVDLAAQLASEDQSPVTLAKWSLAAQRERNDGGERKAIDGGVLLLAEQLLGGGERRCATGPRTVF